MPAQDGGVPGVGLDRAVLAELLDRFRAVVGGVADETRPFGPGPDPISQWTAAEQDEGPQLCAVVDMLGPQPPDVVAALALGIAAELAGMHAAGTVHRRLTPSNVLLPETGARLVHSGVPHTVDGATVPDLDGSPLMIGYLTPEQVLGQPIGPETDIFALGGVLAFAASGVSPFGNDEPLSVLYRIVNEEPALDIVPDSVRGLIKACLSKDPVRRPTLQTLTTRAIGVLKDARIPQQARSEPARPTLPIQPAQSTLSTQPARPTLPVQPTQLAGLATATTASMSIPVGPVGHRRRKRSVDMAVLGTIVIGVAAAFLVRGLAESSTPSPGQSAVLPAPSTATTSAAATATISAPPPATLPGSFLTGPGCPASQWATSTESVAPASGLAANVGGGFADCGGKAIAFLKTGTTAPGASSFTWSFRLGRSARCTLSVYIADADSSSGYAHYRLSIPASHTSLIFQINQSAAKGKFAAAKELADLALPDGSVQLVLTDAGAYAGDRFHVTASAVRASCAPAA